MIGFRPIFQIQSQNSKTRIKKNKEADFKPLVESFSRQ